MVRFSLIIPVYNKEKCIINTLNSVIQNHDMPDDEFECILVNESSTDLSGQICESFSKLHSYFRYFEIENDGVRKPSNARNFGKSIASGQYIMFLDADDYLCVNFINDVCVFLDNNSEYDFYVGNRYCDDEFVTHNTDNFKLFGPSLSSCVFRKSLTDSLEFENIINEDIVYTEKLILAGYRYYHDVSNPPTYVYNTQDSEMIQADIESVKKYKNWICGPAEVLQYNFKYDYCINDDNDLIYKYNKKIQNVDIFILNYCNLNCYSCSSFCPIVERENRESMSVDDVVKELNVIQRFRDDIVSITILGGETMLHPNLSEILTVTRKMFPNNEIHIITNGTLYKDLYKIRDSIIKNNIICKVSLYPVPNINEIKQAFKNIIPEFNLLLLDYTQSGFIPRHLATSTHNEVAKIFQCIKRRGCHRLEGNRFYICHYAADLKILKQKYGDRIKINNNDSFIEITETTTIDDIYNFIRHSTPEICFHCLDVLQENTEDGFKYWQSVEWRTSDKDISEFYIE